MVNDSNCEESFEKSEELKRIEKARVYLTGLIGELFEDVKYSIENRCFNYLVVITKKQIPKYVQDVIKSELYRVTKETLIDFDDLDSICLRAESKIFNDIVENEKRKIELREIQRMYK